MNDQQLAGLIQRFHDLLDAYLELTNTNAALKDLILILREALFHVSSELKLLIPNEGKDPEKLSELQARFEHRLIHINKVFDDLHHNEENSSRLESGVHELKDSFLEKNEEESLDTETLHEKLIVMHEHLAQWHEHAEKALHQWHLLQELRLEISHQAKEFLSEALNKKMEEAEEHAKEKMHLLTECLATHKEQLALSFEHWAKQLEEATLEEERLSMEGYHPQHHPHPSPGGRHHEDDE